MTIRVRFAPSPTGFLHIGGARTALFNWLYARRQGGVFVLRIEDTDLERSKPEYETQILDAMKWLGLDSDEGPVAGGDFGPYRQSDRTDTYLGYLDRLLTEGKAYRCTCSRERLEAIREQQVTDKTKRGYDSHCRDASHGPDCGPHVIRLKMPQTGTTIVDDLIKGPAHFENAELNDWILHRTDGAPIYNFVVVVDDHEMGITHVVRGDDHLNNTPRQVCLYNALGFDVPAFAHLPMILGQDDGKRLSKRHGATSVGEYRKLGFLSEALINYLTRLGWAHGDMEAFSTEESTAVFSLEAVNKTGARWDMEKLTWLNQHWMKQLSADALADRARPFFEALGLTVDDRLPSVVASLAERAKTLVDLAEQGAFYFTADDAIEHDPAAVKKFMKASRGADLDALIAALEGVEDWSEAALEAAVQAFLEANELKLSRVAQPVRVSITGQRVGPGLYETLAAIGKPSALARLRIGAGLCHARAKG
ncbi:MAG: glutamyl-tRNA synthetase [Myxococcota bacterium]|jgi:glutamyl-tRNA synthetase